VDEFLNDKVLVVCATAFRVLNSSLSFFSLLFAFDEEYQPIDDDADQKITDKAQRPNVGFKYRVPNEGITRPRA
jgi:hypothetical protein